MNNKLIKYFGTYKKIYKYKEINSKLTYFINICLEVKKNGRKLIFAGNGASASIASHAATDYTQHAGIRAIALNDHNLITAFGNDYGYEQWVLESLKAYADPGDVVVLVSSSGKSPNIVNAATYAIQNNLKVVTFTGFSHENPLRAIGNLNLWVDSDSYNHIEITHLTWILLVATFIEKNPEQMEYLRESLGFIADTLSDGGRYNQLDAYKNLCKETSENGGKVIYLGNGGSSSIASHAATDFTKQSKIRSIAFNDHNLLTCYANDYGQVNWMARAIEAYADPNDAIVCLSASGTSKNVLNAAHLTEKLGLPIITFTGNNLDNPLRKLGNINLWVNSNDYSIISSMHSAWIFSVVDNISEYKYV